jgi:hypothetical protein
VLIIEQRLGLSDRDVVEQITENPYLQFFIGLPAFQESEPFHPSLVVHFRSFEPGQRMGSYGIRMTEV